MVTLTTLRLMQNLLPYCSGNCNRKMDNYENNNKTKIMTNKALEFACKPLKRNNKNLIAYKVKSSSYLDLNATHTCVC